MTVWMWLSHLFKVKTLYLSQEFGERETSRKFYFLIREGFFLKCIWRIFIVCQTQSLKGPVPEQYPIENSEVPTRTQSLETLEKTNYPSSPFLCDSRSFPLPHPSQHPSQTPCCGPLPNPGALPSPALSPHDSQGWTLSTNQRCCGLQPWWGHSGPMPQLQWVPGSPGVMGEMATRWQ